MDLETASDRIRFLPRLVRPVALLLSTILVSATIPGIVADDHGNDSSSATAVDIPSTTAGTLDSGDQDFFRIDIGVAGSLTLESSGTTDTYGILYDGDGAELARDDDGGTNQNFRISRESLAPGTYYLLLRAFGPAVSGDYSLTVSGSAQPPVDAFQFESASAEEASSTADDHGDDPATATVVAIPSTTAGELGAGDKDYFRIDIIRAGILTFETTGSTDTYGTLYDSDGAVIDEDNDRGPRPNNFRITDALVLEGSYFLEVRGASPSRDTGPYELRMTGDARSAGTPAATAPSVSIHAIPSGDEETTVQLGATLSGGAYDGAVGYAWSVDGGTLNSSSSATPTWTRPAVTSNANHTVRLTVTVRGTGTNAESGTSDSASANRQALVRDVPPPLPAADAPAVTINTIPSGNENTTVRLGATLTGGTYDGTPEFAWTVTGSRLSNPNSATPTWTRPSVTSNTNFTVRLTVTARGAGTVARSGTSEQVNANQTARVLDVPVQLPVAAAPSVSINAIPAGNEGTAVQLGATLNGGTYDGALDYAWIVTGGTLNDPAAATPTWTRPAVTSNTNFTIRLTITARGAGTAARNGTSDTANTSRSAQVRNVVAPLPVAAAPSVSIDTIPAGNENTTVQLAATLNGGTYDGTVEYLWSVDGGALDNANAATPTWTRPSVNSNTNYTIRLTVTARGAGTVARNGTSDTANTSRVAQVRNVAVVLPVAVAPSVTINAISAGNEGTTVRLGATLTGGGPYDGAVEYDWSVNGGTLDDDSAATPTWTRPSVTSNTNYTVSLTITVRGSGTTARNSTSDTDSATRSSQVRDTGSTSGDHGNDRASATTVTIPSTTAGTLTRSDRDYFRIEVGQAGSLTLQTRSNIDTYGTLYDSDGSQITRNDDGGRDYNFRISRSSIGAGVYYLQVRGFRSSTTGTYSLEVSGTARGSTTQLPAAAAPAVSINSIPAGDEGTDVQLGATLTGGTYDGAVDYTWSVSDGVLDNPNSATPTWTRPAVNADANHTISLTVSVDGTGTNASSGSSDSASTSRSAQVSNIVVLLPIAVAPSVSIDAIPAGNEGTTVQLGATLTGGSPYDGAVEYDWSANGGTLNDDSAAAPTWTRPSVTSNTNHTVSLTITVRGSGATARNGSSDTASTSQTAQVRNTGSTSGDHGNDRASATTVAIPSSTDGTLTRRDQDWFRIDVGQAGTLRLETRSGIDTYGTLYRSDGSRVAENDDAGQNYNFRISRSSVSVGAYYLQVRGYSGSIRGPYSLEVSGTARGPDSLPVVAAPTVTINDIPEGDEGGTVQLGATVTGGAYDGAVEYFWTVDSGTLDDPASATPTWTRPAVTSNANYTVRLTVTVVGAGTNAGNGSRDTASTSRSAEVRNVVVLPEATAPSVTINTIPAGDEGTDVQLGAALAGGTYDGTPDYAWTVDGGTLDDPTSATPTWTRPAVTSDTNYTVSLTVTVGGSGITASNDSSDTANTSRTAQARDVASPLPVASAPTVSFNFIPAGYEGTTVQLGATLAGGTYDGTAEYVWSVDGGTLDNANLAAPTWTRPLVSSNTHHTLSLRVRVRGTGTTARSGTSDAVNLSRSIQVRNGPGDDHGHNRGTATPVSIPSSTAGVIERGDTDWFRFEIDQAGPLVLKTTGGVDTWGRLYRSEGSFIAYNEDDGAGFNFRIAEASLDPGVYYIEVRGYGSATGAYRLEVAVTDDDHGNDRGSATPVAIPSTTAGVLERRDRDYFRIDIAQEGTLQLETRGSGYADTYSGYLDTYGVLYRSNGQPITSELYGGERLNFLISMDSVSAGTYFLEVRGNRWRDRGAYRLEVSGTARGPTTLPAAVAPSVSVNAIPDDDEGTSVQLGATLSGGTYDGTLEYAWSVDGGLLDNASAARPTWTRPAVTANTNHTIGLTVTARGTGSVALNGTSDTATASRAGLVRDIPPVAAAPAVSINAIAGGDEGATVQLSAALSGGTYDGAPEYVWSVDGGTLDDPNAATPSWTRPSVATDTQYTASLTVRVQGTGTAALSGTSATANASRTAQVRDVASALPVAAAPSVAIDAIPLGKEGTTVQFGATLADGTYDGTPEYLWSVDGGALDDASAATPTWTRPAVPASASYTVRLTVSVRGTGTGARSGTSATASASRSAQVSQGGGDDHGNNRATATPVVIPSTTAGVLEPWDRDWFRIEIDEAGPLTLEATGRTWTWGRLYDSNGRQVAQNTDGGINSNFRISRRSIDAGVYYLEVRGIDAERGAYSLKVSRFSNDHGHDQASATPVGIPSTTAGMLERYDRDWFRIDVAQAGTLRLETTGRTDTFGTLYSADGSELAKEDYSPRTSTDFRILMDSVAAGTYYLQVRGGYNRTRGAYSLEVSGTARGAR